MTARTLLGILPCTALLLFAGAAVAAEGDSFTVFPDLLDDMVAGRSAGPLWQRLIRSEWLQLIVLFAALVFPAKRLLFDPLLGVMDERERRSAGARREAGEASAQADSMQARYESAVAEARQQAEGLRREALDEARREQTQIAAAARETSERRITGLRDDRERDMAAARAELEQQCAGLARDMAARVLGRPLS